jgi:hypothetical protein
MHFFQSNKAAQLRVENWPKQLSGYLPLTFALPGRKVNLPEQELSELRSRMADEDRSIPAGASEEFWLNGRISVRSDAGFTGILTTFRHC